MKLVLQRLVTTKASTVGELFVDGVHECWTLEDVVRADGVKIPGETAIPAQLYKVELTYSPRFHQVMPLLTAVMGFVGIRIHWGNTAKDTDGCILVGTDKTDTWSCTPVAYEQLFAKLDAASDRKQLITIDVRNVPASQVPKPRNPEKDL